MYSFPDLESVCCSMSSSSCCFLACIQVLREASKVVWYSHLFENFPQFLMVHTVKGFSIVNETEVYLYLKFSCFFYDPMDVGTLPSGSSAFSKSRLNICMGDEYNCLMVWTFFSTALLRKWDENWPLSVLCHSWAFQICWHIECNTWEHHPLVLWIALLESHFIH